MISFTYTNKDQAGDLDRGASLGKIVVDEGLKTAVLLSLFTWRRSDDEDSPPNSFGWWGDSLLENVGDRVGSRLWLLYGSKVTEETLTNARAYAEEALAWMIEDGVADSVEVVTERQDIDTIAIVVSIQRPADTASQFIGRWEITVGHSIREAA